jgi:hypothetical protein
MLKSGKDHKDRGIWGISELCKCPIVAAMRIFWLATVACVCMATVSTSGLTPTDITAHLGTYQGTLRNASGVLQLGGADATKSVVVLSASADSLRLDAMDKAGTMRRIGSWPMTRVSAAGESFTANGLPKGALHLRRTLTWKRTAGIRVNAELSTANASQREDDYFGGSRVQLTLLKIR